MKKTQPSTIPLQHYEAMPPSTSRNYYDNQYISLFGDPVQPLQQNDYLEKLDTQLYSRFRRNSSLFSTNLEDEEEFPKPDIYVEVKDERPKTSRILRSGISKNRVLNKENISHNYNLKIVPENTRLFNSNNLGPDIRILSDSGSGSSENLQNFGKNQQLSNLIPLDTTYTIHREPDHLLRNDEQSSRKLSQDLDGFSDVKNYDLDREQKQIFSNEPSQLTREFSNESYSSSDWFKPSHDYQEFTKIPKLRPSSKNVMSINKPERNDQESPVATLLIDSNGSSSDEKLSDQKIYSEVDSIDRPFVVTSSPQYAEVHQPEERTQPIPQPRKLPIQMSNINEIASNMKENFSSESAITSPLRRAPSPAILTSTICTGADFRIQAPKSHKTKSFSIIAENSNQSSLIDTPPNQQKEISNGRLSPFLGRGFKEPPRPPPRQKRALTSTNLRLPAITNTSDDSPRPSVQFDITANSIEKSVPRSILHRPSISAYGMPPKHPQNAPNIKSFETLPNISGRNIMRKNLSKRLNNSSIDISEESRTASATGVRFENPTSREKGLLRIINSADSSPSRIPIKSNWIPSSLNDLREDQQFLLPPRGDRRKSSTSTERRSSSQTDHRNSLTSERRSSNMSSVTTSDFSYRRNSLSPPRRVSPTNFRNLRPSGRRKSISLSPINLQNHNLKNSRSNLKIKKNNNKNQRRIAKPTTLSPILGTPNKDDPLSPEEVESSSRFISNIPRTDSLTRIPIRNGSNLVSKPDSQLNLAGVSNVNSRSASPQKEFAPVSRPNSRADTEAPVKVTNRSNSRVSTSRISRPSSRVDSKPPSRTSSRASSYQSNNNVSRSNSRLSISPPKSKGSSNQKNSVSKKRSPSPKKSRKKSVSPNKSTSRSRTRSRSRSRSKSPDKKSKVSSRQRPTKKSKNSSSESPKRSTSRKGTNLSAKSSTNDNKKNSTKSKTSSSSSGNRKNIDSKNDLKRSGSNIRKEGLTRESSSIRKKEPLTKRESSNLKREPSNLKREPSSLKREPSKMSLRKDPTSTLKREPSSVKSGQLKKEPSNMKIENTTKLKREPSNLIKTRTDSNLSKKLENKNSTNTKEKQADKNEAATENKSAKEEANGSTDSNDKLVPLTKQNVISMTTAAITAQPVQITTAVTNQIPFTKTNSSGQLLDNKGEALPSVILEKSQKTLENIQKTVTEATDEIHKTINENLTDLKTLETDMGKSTSNGPKVPFEKADSLKTIQENPTNGGTVNSKSLQPIEASVSVLQGSDHLQPSPSGKDEGSGGNKLGEDMAERVSERAISVLPDVECESANLQTNDQQVSAGVASTGNEEMNDTSEPAGDATQQHTGQSGDGVIEQRIDEIKAGENNDAAQNLSGISQEHLDEDLETTGCCGRSKCCKRSKCCTRLCMPCRRSRCCRKKQKEAEEAIMKEVDEVAKKTSCWKGLNCCKRKQKTGVMGSNQMETITEETDSTGMAPKKQNKCGLCLRKFFCCRATNKIETTSTEAEEARKCCFCIPCRRKRPVESRIEPAWQAPPAETSQRRESILSTPAGPPESRCTRIMNKLKFWKKKQPSRRASMGSRKQSLAPTNPPEDTRPKLHNDLVEYNSKMKGAIPVLPIYLAYFCTGCNIICPGLGTILSGLFCLCVGIPRFSQYDSAKARIGSFVINCIVGVSQLFCVLFCFVGWGWSIWWGTIMMRTARKLQKIRKVERLELEEEQRQAQAAAAAATAATATGGKPNDKDVEAGKP